MKIAIIGSGPLAIICANHFHHLGAEVTLFQRSPLGGNIRFLSEKFPQFEMTFENKKKTLASFWEENLIPEIKTLESNHLSKAGEVLRVHKRFLQKDETINGRSRLHDLFRLIYSVNPKEAILKQLEENPEMFKQLGDQVINSLHQPVESFEDFDIVIEARGLGKKPKAMGPSHAMALNENNIKDSGALFYEKEIFNAFDLKEKKNLVVVGNKISAILALIQLKDWLFSQPEHTLSWVTPTQVTKELSNEWAAFELKELLTEAETHFEKEKIVFEKKIREWRDLEDYVKVKIPKPIEPEPKLKIYQGYDVTSVDRLLDRTGVFATIESPDFREFTIQNDLKTLPADALLIGFGVENENEFAKGMTENEPGYYKLEAETLEDGVRLIKHIEEKILSFFSRVQ